MADRILNFLGLARRAAALSLGHDAARDSILSGRAVLCITAADASARLQEEFRTACEKSNKPIEFQLTGYTMDEIGMCIGAKKTAVLTVDDAGFAQKLIQMIREGS